VGHVRDVDPEAVARFYALDGDRIIEVLGVRPVDGDGREGTEVFTVTRHLAGGHDGFLLHPRGEPTRGVYRGEESIVDVSRIFGGAEDLRHLAAQRTALLANADEDYVSGLRATAQPASHEDRAPLLDE
jgi:integrase